MSSKIPRVTAGCQKNARVASVKSKHSETQDASGSTKVKVTNGRSTPARSTSNTNSRSSKKQVASFSHGTQKTMSYTQLKQEVVLLQEENYDLRNRVSKQQNALHTSQRTTKNLQKENQDLKEQRVTSEKEYADSMEVKTQEWTSRNNHLEDRLTQCEVKLEELGVDPVSLESSEECGDATVIHQQRAKAAESACILKQKLEDNIMRSEKQLQQIQNISSQCQLAIAELDG